VSAPANETHNRPGRGPANDVKVDADDGGGPADAQSAPEANAAPEHGATGEHSTHGRPSRPTRNRPVTRPASRPGTGADSGFADADDMALPPEATEAIQEADELQHSTQHAAGPRNAAPQGAAPAEAPAAAPAAPRGAGRNVSRPPNQDATDQSTNQTSNRRVAGPGALKSMPVAFFSSNPVARASRLVLHTSAGTSPERTVTLQCDPPGGTHPKAPEACADVTKAGGDLAQMPANKNPRACFMIYAPVTVTAKGDWQGQPVRFTEKFPNSCVMRDKTGSVFDF
jgi:hypothetical protein